jgi:hypothetical protein
MGLVSLLVSAVMAVVGGYVAVLTAFGTIEALHDGVNLLRRSRTTESATPGRVKLRGRVGSAGTGFSEPLTGDDVVAAQLRKFEQNGHVNRLLHNWEESDCQTVVRPFRLRDAAGEILVDPTSVHKKTLSELSQSETVTRDADEPPTASVRNALDFLEAGSPGGDPDDTEADTAAARDDRSVRARPDGGVSTRASNCPQKFTCATLTPGDEVYVLGRLERLPDGSEVITADPNLLVFDGSPRRVAVKKGAEALALGLVTLFVTGFLYNLFVGLLF